MNHFVFGYVVSGVAPSSSFNVSTGGYEGSYGDLYRSGSGSVYNDSAWRSAASEIDGSGSFGYGLGGIASDDPVKSSEGYIGNYNVTSRQPNRGKILSYILVSKENQIIFYNLFAFDFQ